MEYFLRFTDNAQRDLEKGYSFFKKTEEKLPGLCGFRLAETTEEFENLDLNYVIKKYQNNCGYSNEPVIFTGSMIGRGPIEGDLFTPEELI